VTKKILAVLVVLLLASVGLVAGCGGNLPKSAAARVGNIIITQQAFDERIADFAAQYAGQVPDKATDAAQYKVFQQDVLEYMITYELASQASTGMKITVTDADVQAELDKVKTSTFGGDQAQFDAALKQQGITLDQLKRSYRESMLLQKVYEEVTKSVTTVPDKDIQAYYDAHKTNYFVAETRTARHILLTPVSGRTDATTSTTTSSSTTSTTAASTTGSSDSSSTTSDTATATASSSTTTTSLPTQADWDSALAAAQLVRAQLVAGADWTIEAKMYSDDPGSKETGGDLGTISKGQMVKEFEDAVFSQKKDEISQPVKTAYGYHIIQVTGITEAKQYTLDEVKAEITSTLLNDAKSRAWQAWVKAQKEKVGVVYAQAWVTTTTTTAAPTFTTTPGGTATTAAPSSDTTAAPSSDTTAAPATTTTAGAPLTTAGTTATTAKQ
jgi:parvulin-like peptidyl-prolyl isomerase